MVQTTDELAMLAIIMFMSTAESGRASGIVMLGFLAGMTISAPITGLAVDVFDTYRPVWLVAAALAAGAAALVLPDPSRRRVRTTATERANMSRST